MLDFSEYRFINESRLDIFLRVTCVCQQSKFWLQLRTFVHVIIIGDNKIKLGPE